MNRTRIALASLAIAAAASGCSSRTDVSATGNTPAKYAHVWITTQEVWFNGSATAGPGDGGWAKFPLSTPMTVDLVADSGGSLASVVTGLKLAPATYAQMRLIPVDAGTTLTDSASTAGAIYNAEADYVDTGGTTHQLALELLNPEQGIGIPGILKVPVGNVGAALASTSTTGNTTTPTAFTGATPTNDTTTGGTTTTTTPTTSTTGTTTVASFALFLDGTHDLTPFTYGGAATPNAILLSAHPTAYDLAQAGAISGQLTLTNLTGTGSGLAPIQVNAEILSSDGSRHVTVNTAPVHADGSFLVYPLSSDATTATNYDLVIHGPGIATIIIKSIPVTLTSSTTTGTATSGASTVATTDLGTGGTTATGTTVTVGTDTTAATTTSATTTSTTTATPVTIAGQTVTPVSVGTLVPRSATPYAANLAGGTALPAGAQVIFYQTLGGSGEVPYAIEASAIDPFNQVLADNQQLSTGTIDSGTFTTSGASVTLVSAAPAQGKGNYVAAASAPEYRDGAFSATLSQPAAGVTATAAPPGLSLATGANAGTLTTTVSAARAGKYDHGELLLTHDGALVASTALDAALAQGGNASVVLTGVPAGLPAALYYLTVRAWNSSDPTHTLTRQSYPTPIDLRSSATGSAELTIN